MTRAEFEGLVERHHRDMVRLAYAMCRDRELAEDAAQACWQAALQHVGEIREPDRIRGWLFTVTANEVRRQLRRRRIGEILRGRIAPARSAEVRPEFLDLASAIQTLSLRDRQLVAMKYAAGLTSDEIGVALGLSGVGVRRRLQTVLARLRTELGDDRT